MATINRDIARFDITAIHTHPDATVDIILVHGLNGGPEKTWTASNKTYWPADLLPETLKQGHVHVNVLVWGYNADVISKDKHPPSQNFLHHHAQNLVSFLGSYRRDTDALTKPIIWVAHSLGGLLLKSALSHADRCREPGLEHLRSIFVSTYAIIFLGTPHEGSGLAKYGEILQNMAEMTISKRLFETQPILLKTLRSDSETLDNINFEFIHIMQKFEVCLVYEEATTKIGTITKRIVVDQRSAAPTFWGSAQKFGIEANHSDMCKFAGVQAPGYRSLSSCILDWARKAPEFIAARWVTEKENRLLQAKATCREMAASMGSQELVVPRSQTDATNEQPHLPPPSPIPTLSMQTSDQPSLSLWASGLQSLRDPVFFYHPEVFRPNSYSVGREDLLTELHRMLQDPERRKSGTSAALVRGRTGGGKTHLVRNYVYEHKSDYSGGVFWLNAHSYNELVLDLPRLWQLINNDQKHEDSLEDIVRKVRSWFSKRQQWLLILDGIMSDEGIENFIPDAPNTFLIYTSTSPTFTGKHIYNNPKMLDVPVLSMHDAQGLLLEEMGHAKPWTDEVLDHARLVVRSVESLPLMIHVLGQHLKETREPLSGFIKRLKRYEVKPTIHGRIYPFDSVLSRLEERGASAALNVLYLLAFFGKYIPVEMLALGLRSLTLPWKTGEAGSHTRPTLNNTLRVLIAFALVERSDRHEISPVSSRTSKKSLELAAPPMDTLKLYPLVQRYIVEHMEREKHEKGKTYLYWLQRAIDVFCRSLKEADARIKESSRVGLPVDYQQYRIHGRQILRHILRYESSAVEMTPGRLRMEDRLQYVDWRFQELETQTSNTESGASPRCSVFDRANSLSESDSSTFTSQANSLDATTPPTAEQAQEYLSRIHERFGSCGLPYPVEDEESADENGGITPMPEFLTKNKRSSSLWGPAEVSVSRDHAAGSSFQASSHKPNSRAVSATSDAEIALLKVRKSPTLGGGVVHKKGRSASSGSRSTATELFRTDQGHYTVPTPAGLTPSEERSAAEFYVASETTSLRASTLVERVKENWSWERLRRGLSAKSTTKPTLEAPSSAKSSPGARQAAVMPNFSALVDRSVSSSPGQGVSPFPPTESRSTLPLRLSQPPGLHKQYTEPYQPSLPRVDSSSLDPMAMSIPSPEHASDRGGAFIPTGRIDSTPMSRGSSRQSSNTSRGRPSGDYSRGTSIPRGSSDYVPRAPSPFSGHLGSTARTGDMSWDGQGVVTLPPNMMETTSQIDLRRGMGPPDLRLRTRRGSVSNAMIAGTGGAVGVFDSFGYGHTRMSSQASNIMIGAGSSHQFRSRQSSNASSVGQQPPIMPPIPPPPESPAPMKRQNPYRRAISAVRRGSGRGSGRTQSESPSAGFRMPAPGFPPSQGSPELASEPMSRGSSGGFVVGSGPNRTLVPFGDTTAEDLHDASRRLRQQRIDRQQPPGIPPRRSSASSSRGSFRSQISPPLISRGNSGRGVAGAGPGTGLGIIPGDHMEDKN